MEDAPMIAALLALLGIAGYFCVRYLLLKRSVRSADRELREIVEELGENRIVKISAPDRDLEKLLATVNRALGAIRSEAVRYAQYEAELKSQVERISHDLRTPLTSIIGYLSLVDDTGLDEETRASLATVRRKADSLQRLISQFYDLSALRGEGYRLDLGPVEVGRMLRESVAGRYRLLSDAGLDVRLSVPSHAVFAQANGISLERVVENLLHNAGRYAKTEFEATLSEDAESNCVLLKFSNDVEALSESEVGHLFEPFYTVDGSRTQESSGLGLAIAKHLVEHMGGSMEAQLEERGGVAWLSFTVTLDAAEKA